MHVHVHAYGHVHTHLCLPACVPSRVKECAPPRCWFMRIRGSCAPRRLSCACRALVVCRCAPPPRHSTASNSAPFHGASVLRRTVRPLSLAQGSRKSAGLQHIYNEQRLHKCALLGEGSCPGREPPLSLVWRARGIPAPGRSPSGGRPVREVASARCVLLSARPPNRERSDLRVDRTDTG